MAAQLLARGAAEAVAAPDFTEGVDAGVAAAVYGGEAFLQFFAAAEGFLDGGHSIGRQHLVEVGLQFGV